MTKRTGQSSRDQQSDASHEQRIAQLERLLELCRQDRQLIACEIHDGIVQEMTAALMYLEAARGAEGHEACRANLDEAAELLRRSIEDARRLMNGLHPPELADRGLEGAVAALIDMLPAGGPKVALDLPDDLGPLDETVQLAAFRVIQESLTNVVRHSQSPRAAVQLWREGEEIRLRVQDWGVGFDTAQKSGGFGLRGIEQRARLLGGSAEVRSEPGRGTTIEVRLPAVAPCSTP